MRSRSARSWGTPPVLAAGTTTAMLAPSETAVSGSSAIIISVKNHVPHERPLAAHHMEDIHSAFGDLVEDTAWRDYEVAILGEILQLGRHLSQFRECPEARDVGKDPANVSARRLGVVQRNVISNGVQILNCGFGPDQF